MADGAGSRPPLPAWPDAALALGLAAVGLVEVWALPDVGRAAGVGAVLALTLPLGWRRAAPLATAVAVFGFLLATVAVVVPIDELVVFIPVLAVALYSLGAYAGTRRSLLGLALALVTVLNATLAEDGPGAGNLLFGVVVAAGPWTAGRLVRRRTAQAVRLALRAQELERSQRDREQAAVAEERSRIARELHDVIAHSVSVMTVQAGALESVLDHDLGKAREAAASIRLTGRQAQVDLRRLLGLLREGDAPGQMTPQPGLRDLDELVAHVRRAGVDVRLEVEGAARRLPSAVELSAFRLVQEALTNVLKHSGASTATVGVRYGPTAVDIEVIDDGSASGPVADGHGLIGMQERVGLYGGRLEYGHRNGGGFRVRALLPVGEQP